VQPPNPRNILAVKRFLRIRADPKRSNEMSTKAQIVLRNLAEVSRDGEKGFAAAAGVVKDEKLQRVFEGVSERFGIGAGELEDEVVMLGGTPPGTGGTISGALHRYWTNLKTAIAGSDDEAILKDCEREEDAAKAAYEKALSEELPSHAHTIVRRQYNRVVEHRDLIRRLRDAA
jgi:uncharacterized protein (TIGR02284 family)